MPARLVGRLCGRRQLSQVPPPHVEVVAGRHRRAGRRHHRVGDVPAQLEGSHPVLKLCPVSGGGGGGSGCLVNGKSC